MLSPSISRRTPTKPFSSILTPVSHLAAILYIQWNIHSVMVITHTALLSLRSFRHPLDILECISVDKGGNLLYRYYSFIVSNINPVCTKHD